MCSASSELSVGPVGARGDHLWRGAISAWRPRGSVRARGGHVWAKDRLVDGDGFRFLLRSQKFQVESAQWARGFRKEHVVAMCRRMLMCDASALQREQNYIY